MNTKILAEDYIRRAKRYLREAENANEVHYDCDRFVRWWFEDKIIED